MKYFAIFFVLSNPFRLMACEGCKMAASKGISEPQTMMAGIAFSWSVLFMLGAVFLLLGIFAWAMRSACLQADVVHQQSTIR